MFASRYCSVFLVAFTSVTAADDIVVDEHAVRGAIGRALPVLQQGAKLFRERSEGRCISCHHQGLVLQVVGMARERGFAVDEGLAREEVERVHGFYFRRIARYRAALADPAALSQADPFGNFTVHAGYWLWGLAAEKVPHGEATTTAVELLARKQWDDGRWSFTDVARAPMQASDFTTTALAAFALQRFGDKRDENQRSLTRAQAWLVKNPPRTTDDKAFRLLGLHWLDPRSEYCEQALNQLLDEQRSDGGWAQQENMPTDAYATGLVLVALNRAGGISPTSVAYQRGIKYLLDAQQPDGTWNVKSRAIPNNPYFESGFPYGKSQFISFAGSSWATMALLASQKVPSPQTTRQEMEPRRGIVPE